MESSGECCVISNHLSEHEEGKQHTSSGSSSAFYSLSPLPSLVDVSPPPAPQATLIQQPGSPLPSSERHKEETPGFDGSSDVQDSAAKRQGERVLVLD